MFLRTAAILLSVGLHAISTGALPTAIRGQSLKARDDDQCPVGKNFYSCYLNGFKGCCSVDPCDMEDGCPDYQLVPKPAPSSLKARDDDQCPPDTNFYVCRLNGFRGCCSVDPCALEEGCPDNKPEQPTCKNGLARVYTPIMHTIDTANPDDPIETTDLDIINSAKKTVEQTMTFKLPSEAVGKSCSIKWGIPAERDFTVTGNGLTNVEETTNGISKKIGAADFTNWPQTPGPRDSSVGSTKCKEQLDFSLSLREEGTVFLAQNEQTGWFIEYEC